jgi:hypothetical protein
MKIFSLVLVIILALSLFLTALLYFLRRYFVKKTDLATEHLHPSVFSFFTTIYAFFLGFAIVTLWSAFLNAQANVTREADALVIAFRLSKTLPNSEPFRRALLNYVKSVVEDEWPSMADESAMSDKTQEALDKVWESFLPLKPRDKGDNDLFVEVGSRLGEANQQRLSRSLLTRGNLYPPIWVIIIFGFLIVLFGLYFNHLQQNRVRLTFDLMVIFLVLCCIYFIFDIDTPYSGYVVVKPDVFKIMYTKMLSLQ